MPAPETEQYPSGWYTDQEKALLARAAQSAPEGVFIEIGVYRGESARVLAEHSGNRPLWLCDDLSMEGADIDLWPAGPNTIGVSHYDMLPQENIALLHHDAAHAKDTVLCHIQELGPHVLPGGLICLHDFWSLTYPGVQDAWQAWNVPGRVWVDFGRAGTLQVFRREL